MVEQSRVPGVLGLGDLAFQVLALGAEFGAALLSLSLSLVSSTTLWPHGICPTAGWTLASCGHASANAHVREVRP
ncbi:hypothetical protein, partial [Trebonia sp.]|uniref:hypothetical protein n=1 Tax=Trebonia sp. TaxID=2767075 RepID=UPI002624EF6D